MIGTYSIKSKELSQISKGEGSEFCRKGVLPEKTVVLLDHSDSINAVQKSALEKLLIDLSNGVAKNGALTVYSVREDINDNLKSDLSLCNPGDANSVSNVTGNKRMAERNYNKKFRDVINNKLDELIEAQPSNFSPIMKSIQVSSSESFLGDNNSAEVKRLIVVSDLLENTSDFSFFKSAVPDFSAFKNNPYWDAVRSDLSDTEVTIFFLRRDGAEKIQTPELKKFWQQFFMEQGATIVQFKKIPG